MCNNLAKGMCNFHQVLDRHNLANNKPVMDKCSHPKATGNNSSELSMKALYNFLLACSSKAYSSLACSK